MITRAEVEKLGAMHAVEPTMLSLYLAIPRRGEDLLGRGTHSPVAARLYFPIAAAA
jgi:hypothetical protein